MTTTNGSPNLAQRMLTIIQKAGALQKKGTFSGQGSYAYHRIDDVEEHLRELLIEHGVVTWPTVLSHKTETHTDDKNRIVYVIEADVEVAFENADNPEDRRVLKSFGQGIDFSDKGPGKAVSYAIKTLYLSTFHLKGQPDAEGDNIPRPNSGTPQPGKANPPAKSSAPSAQKCPACGSGVWDNRENKRNPKAPDWKCKNKECTGGKDSSPWASWESDPFTPPEDRPQEHPEDTPQYGPHGQSVIGMLARLKVPKADAGRWLSAVMKQPAIPEEVFGDEAVCETILSAVKEMKAEGWTAERIGNVQELEAGIAF